MRTAFTRRTSLAWPPRTILQLPQAAHEALLGAIPEPRTEGAGIGQVACGLRREALAPPLGRRKRPPASNMAKHCAVDRLLRQGVNVVPEAGFTPAFRPCGRVLKVIRLRSVLQNAIGGNRTLTPMWDSALDAACIPFHHDRKLSCTTRTVSSSAQPETVSHR